MAQPPAGVSLYSLYGHAFQYADKTLNQSKYTGDPGLHTNPKAVDNYFEDIRNGAEQLDFILYVPHGFGVIKDWVIPNIRETDDPIKIFTAIFDGERESWKL